MSLPSYIKANNPPSGSGVPSGIIKSVRDAVGESNIVSFVIPTTNMPYSPPYDITTIVKWDGQWASAQSLDAYFQLEFKDRYVLPTFYSIKGKSGWQYVKEWRLYGFNEVGEAMTLISENTSVGSTFCSSGEYCPSDNWGTFQITKNVKPFRYFRLTIKTPSRSSEPFNTLRGFEIFGVYSSNIAALKTKKTYCFASYPYRSHLAAYVLLRLFTTCIAT